MITNFVTTLGGRDFRFNTMSIERLFLFQVYVQEEQVTRRFHMQAGEDGRFKIMDRQACPASCLPLEDALHEAILENHRKTGPVRDLPEELR